MHWIFRRPLWHELNSAGKSPTMMLLPCFSMPPRHSENETTKKNFVLLIHTEIVNGTHYDIHPFRHTIFSYWNSIECSFSSLFFVFQGKYLSEANMNYVCFAFCCINLTLIFNLVSLCCEICCKFSANVFEYNWMENKFRLPSETNEIPHKHTHKNKQQNIMWYMAIATYNNAVAFGGKKTAFYAIRQHMRKIVIRKAMNFSRPPALWSNNRD